MAEAQETRFEKAVRDTYQLGQKAAELAKNIEAAPTLAEFRTAVKNFHTELELKTKPNSFFTLMFQNAALRWLAENDDKYRKGRDSILSSDMGQRVKIIDGLNEIMKDRLGEYAFPFPIQPHRHDKETVAKS